THNPVQQDCRGLGDTVFLRKELLEFVDHQQQPGNNCIRFGAAESRQVLNTGGSEKVSAPAQFVVDALQHAQAELTIAFDRDDPSVGQTLGSVAFKLDAFLEIDEVKLHLLRAVVESGVGNQHVEQGGFTGAGLPGDEHVLSCPFAQRQ